ncbi:MAG: 50S ribosomal protein L30 [Bacteroidales bacterium]|nr:50S ribosomal protein L30 [Bacteroidales bacterium]
MKKVRIRQVISGIGHPAKQKRTLEALGIKKMHQVREVELSPQIEGMINKVRHLLEVEEI